MSIWDIYIKYYDNLNKLLPYQSLLSEVCQELNTGEDKLTLDVGCGTGNLCRKIINSSGGYVIGIDSSKSMLTICRAKYSGISNIDFQFASFNQPLPFNDESFDNIAAVNVLYAAEHLEFTVTEIYRVLRNQEP